MLRLPERGIEMSNGVIVGNDSLKHKWREWYIVLTASRMLIGRVKAQSGVPGSTRRLQPVYDFNSGFVTTPQGMAEMHRAFPFLALQIDGVDLPDQGVMLVPFTDLDTSELNGMEEIIAAAEDLKKQQRAARANLVLAPAGAVPKTPSKH